jgi:hypothetical protein
MPEKIKIQKIFLNAMDSWFSNFIIVTFRTVIYQNRNPKQNLLG